MHMYLTSNKRRSDLMDQVAEALERWLDDGGAPDNEAASTVGAEGFSPLQCGKPQGGSL